MGILSLWGRKESDMTEQLTLSEVFLLNGSFNDIEFYYFLLNSCDIIIVISKNVIVTDVYQFLQSIPRQNTKHNYTCKP